MAADGRLVAAVEDCLTMCMVLVSSLPAGLLVGDLGYSRVLMFVPEDFDPPPGFTTDRFRLEPLTVEHNEADFAAWSSSIEHIRGTAGFEGGSWPRQMTPEENAEDLAMHAKHFAQRVGFTYTVVDPAGDLIGCVYIYPGREGADADVRSWVRADHADLDGPLRREVLDWVRRQWPFRDVSCAGFG